MKPMFEGIRQFFNERENAVTAFKGMLGIASTGSGIAVSTTSIEAWLRIVSLVIGISVGIASFISIVRKK